MGNPESNFHDRDEEQELLLFRLLGGVRLFAHMERMELIQLLSFAEKCRYRGGEDIMVEGDPACSMHVVVAGEVEVYRRGPDGSRVGLARLKPGDSLGEMALIEHGARSASARAISACTTLRIPEARLAQAPAVAAKLYLNIARVVVERLKHSNDVVLFTATHTAPPAEEPEPHAVPTRVRHMSV